MKISFLLHFYQPHNQQDDILDRVVNESYRPLVEGLLKRPRAKVVVNINGALLDLLTEKGYTDIIEGLNTLLARSQIEVTASAMYHAFLPLIPKDEILRQIELNDRAQKRAFGKNYKPSGFFSPEMAVNDRVFSCVSKQRLSWIATPSLSYVNGHPSPNKLYRHSKHDVYTMFRNKRVSSLILSSVVRDAKTLIKETQDLHDTDEYWFCVMDAETFGHHRIGHEKVLFDILDNSFFEPSTATELLKLPLDTEKADLRDCTWTNSEQDFHLDDYNSFVLWKDPTNPIHKKQWAFTNYVLDTLLNNKNKESSHYKKARKMMDKALASDQYWWASVKPWWSLEMVESGAFELLEVVKVLFGGKNTDEVKKAEKYYRDILDKAFYWQRSGYIRKKHLENSATYMQDPFKKRAPAEWFNQLVLEFEDEMKKASQNQDFERAIKWRDALLKIKQNTDIHDVLHVVDELWSARKIPELKPFLEHEWEEFSEYAKDNFKDVTSKEDFEELKKNRSK